MFVFINYFSNVAVFEAVKLATSNTATNTSYVLVNMAINITNVVKKKYCSFLVRQLK